MPMKWYVVHTYSGHENKAKLSLLDRVRQAGLNEKFGDILIPTDTVVELVKGQKRSTTRKFFPGYMFVQMDLDQGTFHLVKNTPKITGFLGGTNPQPVKETEIQNINVAMTEGATRPKPRISFEEGETVRVIDGPFANFTGDGRRGEGREAEDSRQRLDLRPRNAGRARFRAGRESVGDPGHRPRK